MPGWQLILLFYGVPATFSSKTSCTRDLLYWQLGMSKHLASRLPTGFLRVLNTTWASYWLRGTQCAPISSLLWSLNPISTLLNMMCHLLFYLKPDHKLALLCPYQFGVPVAMCFKRDRKTLDRINQCALFSSMPSSLFDPPPATLTPCPKCSSHLDTPHPFRCFSTLTFYRPGAGKKGESLK